jgi:Fe-S oxidoreductase
VALLADTFNTYFEPETLRAAVRVLARLGYRVRVPGSTDGAGKASNGAARPLCCGRTFLSAGLVDEARAEARRLVAGLKPFAERGVPVVGLEPSCLFALRDEVPSMLPGPLATKIADGALLLEQFLVREHDTGRIGDAFAAIDTPVLLHGHCHQKAFAAMGAVESALKLVPGLAPETVASSCCGMAGAFGYGVETQEVSRAMGELSLLPAVRAASPETLVVADGFSCRHQIEDGTGRTARHAVHILDQALRADGETP